MRNSKINIEILYFYTSKIKTSFTIKYGNIICIKDVTKPKNPKWFILDYRTQIFMEIHNIFYENNLNEDVDIYLKNYLRKYKLENLLK